MSLNRFAKRRDETEPDIVKDLKKCGYQVHRQDFPDLALRKDYWPLGVTLWLEVSGITKYRKRTEKQRAFLTKWGIPTVANSTQALAVCQRYDSLMQATSATCTYPPFFTSTSSVGAT